MFIHSGAHPSRTYFEGGERLQGDETCLDLLEALPHALRLNVCLGVGGPLHPLRLDPRLELLLLLLQRPQRPPLEVADCGELPPLGVRVYPSAALASVDFALVAAQFGIRFSGGRPRKRRRGA